MSGELAVTDFPAFFEAVHGHPPFPWQIRLLEKVASEGDWPSVLDLPTGSGKTSAIDIAVFHLALEADRGIERKAPVRIAFVVDRRLVVDDAYGRAQRIAEALEWSLRGEEQVAKLKAEKANLAEIIDRIRAQRSVLRVAESLGRLAERPERPLIARRLRGGIPREDDWARTPAQPTVLCSTVDQIGSRLLFRGYGVTDSMKPVHAGLIGSDCLILLDEAHLAEPFRQTLGWVKSYRGEKWRDPEIGHGSPWGVALLTATPRDEAEPCNEEGHSKAALFGLSDQDRENEILLARLNAPKPARLVGPTKSKTGEESPAQTEPAGEADDADQERAEMPRRVAAIVDEVQKALAHFRSDPANGAANPAIAVVVNRVARAREVLNRLRRELPEAVIADEVSTEPVDGGTAPRLALVIGPARPIDREALVSSVLEPIRTKTWKPGEARQLPYPLILVATQTIEAGVDIDVDALVTEAAPLDALRQRFGRLNRGGRGVKPYAAIVASKSELSPRNEDPVYGKAIRAAWEYLNEHAVQPASKDAAPTIDFGLAAFERLMEEHPLPKDPSPLSPRSDAPVLLPAHLDLLSQTAPIPAADPEVGLYLHGPGRSEASVTVVWRGDLETPAYDNRETHGRTRRLLTLVPPRAAEAIELPIWAVRRWLGGLGGAGSLADVADATSPDEMERGTRRARPKLNVFRWAGDDDRSRWIRPAAIHPGDTIVVPAAYGGVDQYGWNPDRLGPVDDEEAQPVADVADAAASLFAGRRFAVRVAPGLLREEAGKLSEQEQRTKASARADKLATLLAEMEGTRSWRDVRDTLADLDLPMAVKKALDRLDNAKSRRKIEVDMDVYGRDETGRPRGVVFLAASGLAEEKKAGDEEFGGPATTEDDAIGSLARVPVQLHKHCHDVSHLAAKFAHEAGLPPARVADLELAGRLHDLGKADPRFQRWLQYGDPLGPDADEPELLLAKSGRRLPRAARERSELPPRWRHEALSVSLAAIHPDIESAGDADLVLWLIGTHHGEGRPLFPHADRLEQQAWTDLQRAFGLPPVPETPIGPQSLAFDWKGLDWPGLYERLKARYGVWELARMETILRLADHRASERAEEVEDVVHGEQREEVAA